MAPTVLIGLGGTGKEISIKVRRMIVESYGSLDALPIVSFLHIDTEQNAKSPNRKSFSSKTSPFAPLNRCELRETICQAISQQVLGDLGVKLFDVYTFNNLRKDLSERVSNRALDESVGSTQLQISTARKFFELYPTVEQQEAQIKTTFDKSEPFLRFSKEQVAQGWEDKAEKRQTLVGIQGGHKPTDPAVSALRPMIRSRIEIFPRYQVLARSSTLLDANLRQDSHRTASRKR